MMIYHKKTPTVYCANYKKYYIDNPKVTDLEMRSHLHQMNFNYCSERIREEYPLNSMLHDF